ncbi:head-tail joining protein [Nitratireductor sp. GCM10026969]|uniref:head-tail joining protein n=1 Tax=Nitratireductor sp. GCM10026969 TaxID=3252645 RepID=UPI00360D0DC9
MTIPPHPVFGDMPDAFLDALGEGGADVTIGGVPLPEPVRVIARGPFGAIAPDAGYGEPGVNGMTPKASFAEVDVPGLKDGDTMVFKGVAWKIREPLPDGRGMVRCELERA